VAPMMDWSDRHYRYFMRQISAKARLYTEMITTGALLHGDVEHHLAFSAEINLNIGCPSERVQRGAFGACLMAEPPLVANCVRAIREAANLPVTVKHRIGIDQVEEYGFMRDFVGTVSEAGCRTFIVHARNAVLKGLSPKENREIPPLKYDYVYRLKREFPELEIVINGGITAWPQIDVHLQHVDGVMLGRAAYHDPWILAQVDARLFDEKAPAATREEVVHRLSGYAARQIAQGTSLRAIVRHILGLYHGVRGGRRFRQLLSDAARLHDADTSLLEDALRAVS
jgi:tRNA-dihydrouridine synthase A